MVNDGEAKKMGRPALPPERKRTGRLSIRTYPDIEEKARRVGTAAVEEAIRAIKDPDEANAAHPRYAGIKEGKQR